MENISYNVIKPQPRAVIGKFLHHNQATYCDSSPILCGKFETNSHIVMHDPEGKIVSQTTRVGTCLLTGIVCWKAAQLLAEKYISQ